LRLTVASASAAAARGIGHQTALRNLTQAEFLFCELPDNRGFNKAPPFFFLQAGRAL
jgi:hypothetical protein